MLTHYSARIGLVCFALSLLLPAFASRAAAVPAVQGWTSTQVVYHQLTKRVDHRLTIDSPILSGNGQWAVWADSPRDPQQVNRVYAVAADDGTQIVVDSYKPLCACQSWIDVSDETQMLVSTDGVRLRVIGGFHQGAQAREVLLLAHNAIGAVQISGDGQTIAFLVKRDTTILEANPLKRGTPIPRGLWVISAFDDAKGGTRRHLVGTEKIAAASGVTMDLLRDNFYESNARPLAISDDGRRVVFAAGAKSPGDTIFTYTSGDADSVLTGTSGPVEQVIGPMHKLHQLAISGDGQTLAFAATDAAGRSAVTNLSGGGQKPLPGYTLQASDRLQLSRDGRRLLIGTSGKNGVLVDVATLAVRSPIVAVPVPPLFVGDGVRKGTMNAEGTRILYVGLSLPLDPENPLDPKYLLGNDIEDLVVLDLDGQDLGAAPLIKTVEVTPGSIPADGSSAATVEVEVSWSEKLPGVALAILRNGEQDPSFSELDLVDREGPDPTRGQGTFTTKELRSSVGQGAAPAAGPRTLRVAARTETAAGLLHVTVVDIDGKLTVTSQSTSGLFRLDGLPADVAAAQRLVDSLRGGLDLKPEDDVVVRAFHAELRLDPAAERVEFGGTGTVFGGAISWEVVNQTVLDAPMHTSDAGVVMLLPFPATRFTFETTGMPPPTSDIQWFDGQVGYVEFNTTMTTYYERDNPPQDPFSRPSRQGFSLAIDDAGSLVLCSEAPDRWNPEQMRQACLANPFVALPPVDEQVPA